MGIISAAVRELLVGTGKPLVGAVVLFFTVLVPQGGSAFNQPGANLNTGFSNFADGGGPPVGYPAGLYLAEVVQWYEADTFRDANGNRIPGRNEVSVLVNTNQLIWLPGIKEPLTGAEVGVDLVIPFIGGSVKLNGMDSSNSGGLGDIIISPAFQWNHHTLFGLPYYHRFEVHTSVPTGEFDQQFAFNPGSNVWTVAPYYAQSLWFLPYLNLEVSFRHYWRYSTKNPDTDIQAGQLYILNYSASYGLTQNWRVGFMGYLVEQLTDDELNGVDIADSKERVHGLGGGLLYNVGHLTLMLQYYEEFAARNRPEGFRLQGRLIYAF